MYSFFKLIAIFSFLTLSIAQSYAAVDAPANREFRESIEKYFIARLGPDAIVSRQYTGHLLEQSERAYVQGSDSTGKIVREVGYLELNNGMICRIGLGFSWPHRNTQERPWEAVYAECAYMSDVIQAKGSFSLQQKFEVMRDEASRTPVPFEVILQTLSELQASRLGEKPQAPPQLQYDILNVGLEPARLYYFNTFDSQRMEILEPEFGVLATVSIEFFGKFDTVKRIPLSVTRLKPLACKPMLVADKSKSAIGKIGDFVRLRF